MPLINFQRQFASPILRGEKPHTVRRQRQVPIKVGDVLHLYTGLRTKDCRKIGRAICSKIDRITVIIPVCDKMGWDIEITINGKRLSFEDACAFALRDGFKGDPYLALQKMTGFFYKRYRERFEGVVIHWKGLVRSRGRVVKNKWLKKGGAR